MAVRRRAPFRSAPVGPGRIARLPAKPRAVRTKAPRSRSR